jgi:tetratricopeptide (TPR) repeat protein
MVWALPLAVVLVYLPVILTGGFIWDDPQYITQNPVLRTAAGLAAIWIHPTTTPQYYPIVHTTFWVEYHLWGLHPLGYHLDNVLLHALGSVLLWRVLRRLEIPGAELAAAIFALHPVQVESVAWATERKNVLSLVFYLLSLHAYLSFGGEKLGRERSRVGFYFLSLLLFIFALLSKSVTCSLPAAILLLVYWRQGRIGVRDVRPLIPYFIIGAAMAEITARLEAEHVGAFGREWAWTFGDRCLIAGRALWFYAGKLIYPGQIAFVYPKWNGMSFAARPWLVMFPLAAAGVILALWLLRKRMGRGPLVGVLFFAGTLLPALGFVNLYPMRYSLVADHFQYTACIGLIVLFAAYAHRWDALYRAFAVVYLVALAGLAMGQQRIYRNAITLWQDTLELNPTSWMAWGNLGDEYAEQSNRADATRETRDELRQRARECYAKLNELAPDQPITHLKWGIVKEFDGDWDAAISEFSTAIGQEPSFSPAMNSLGLALAHQGRTREAMEYFRRAIAMDPGYAEARYNLGVALENRGDYEGAMEQYRVAVSRRPDYPDAQYNLANLLLVREHRPDLSLQYFAGAIAQRPGRADYRVNYAVALRAVGQLEESRRQCAAALKIDANFAPARQLWQALQAASGN